MMTSGDTSQPPRSNDSSYSEELDHPKKKDSADLDPLSRKPLDDDFQQQRLRAYFPLISANGAIVIYFIVAIILFGVGLAIYYASNGVIRYERRYDDIAKNAGCNERMGQTCSVTIKLTIEENMEPPIYFYYKLENFYQNHRRYVKSRSDQQLQGKNSPKLGTCEPLEAHAGASLYPCGLVANSIFNDTFSVSVERGSVSQFIGSWNESDSVGRWDKKGIAFPIEVEDKYKRLSDERLSSLGWTRTGPYVNPLPYPDDEDMMVWLSIAPLSTFLKLYRIIRIPLTKDDTLSITINSRYNIEEFNGKKSFVLSTASWMGGKNSFLGWAYIAAAIYCLFVSFILVLKRKIKPRTIGDLRYYQTQQESSSSQFDG